MSIINLQPIKNYDALNINRVIYSDYKCNCTKSWVGDDILVIFKAVKSGIEKVYENFYTGNVTSTVETIAKLVAKEITDKAIIAGGHTVVNLKDRFHVSDEVARSADVALGLIAYLQEKEGKYAEFLMPLNDFYMEKDAGTDEGCENTYRREAVNPYIIPPKINALLLHYSEKLGREIRLHYCSEKNMADRFKRHIKDKKKDGSGVFIKDGSNWEMVVCHDKIVVLANDKPNCVAGNAATLRAIRYEIANKKIKDNFTSHVGIYPLCSLDNVLNGYKVATAFYNLDLPTYFVFFGRSCFENSTIPARNTVQKLGNTFLRLAQ